MTIESRPIGVFDSGVGGLTVVNALLGRFPSTKIVYFADQAHVPYGDRPLEEILGFASGISDFLVTKGCRAIVMACNISSATALAEVALRLGPVPVIGMIEAGVDRAISQSPLQRIGVLATTGTVKTGAFSRTITQKSQGATVIEVACPALVPIVEAGDTESLAAAEAVREYLAPLAAAQVDTIILGCTHYPFLLKVLQCVANLQFLKMPVFIDPAEAVVLALSQCVALDSKHEPSEPLLITSGNADTFNQQAKQLVQGITVSVCGAVWRNDALQQLI